MLILVFKNDSSFVILKFKYMLKQKISNNSKIII